MKKVCGGLAGCLFLLVMSMGCSGTKKELSSTAKKGETTPIQIVVDKKGYESTSRAPVAHDESYDTTCQQDSDCVVVPVPESACIPCTGTAGQAPANRTSAREAMANEKETCLPILQELQKSKKAPTKSKHETCSHNGAKCVEGQCQLATLSEEEVKKLMPNMPRGQQGAPQRAPQSAPSEMEQMGTRAPMGGQFPIEPKNGSARFDESTFAGTSFPSRYGQDLSTNTQPAFRFGGQASQLEGPRAPQGYGRPNTLPAYQEQFGRFGNR